MKTIAEFLASHRYTHELLLSTLMALGVYAACALIILIAERADGKTLAVYKSRNALHDLAYTVFYKCSFYNVLVFPLFAWLGPWLGRLHVLPELGLPQPVAFILSWVSFDFFNYWIHRLQHSVRMLWALHSVHHSQTQLTFLTANRIHAAEQFYSGVLLMMPALLLGVAQPQWLPLLMLQIFSETVQHARLEWTYGKLGRVLVSPRFHAVHHSIDERDHDANFGRILSVWDRLFGTQSEHGERPRRYGIEGVSVEESLARQFLRPLRELVDAGAPRKYDAPVVR